MDATKTATACVARWWGTAFGRAFGAGALIALASCGGSSPQVASSVWAPSTDRSEDWVLVTVHAARIAESLESGTTWDVDTRAAQEERARNSASAIGSLIGLANPALGTAFRALSELSSDVTRDDASPTHPDPFIEVAFGVHGEVRRHHSPVFEDNVRPVIDHAFLVRTSALGTNGIDVLVKDHDGDAAAPLIGEVRVPREALLDVVRSGDGADLVLQNHELLEISIRIQAVREQEILGATTDELPLAVGIQGIGDVAPAGARVRVRARGQGRIGAGFACNAEAGPRGVRNGGCNNYNLRVGSLPGAPHGSAVVLLGRSPDVTGFSLADVDMFSDTPCAEFIAPTSGAIVVGVNDNDFRNNAGSYQFEITFGVPPDGSEVAEPGVPYGCSDPDVDVAP